MDTAKFDVVKIQKLLDLYKGSQGRTINQRRKNAKDSKQGQTHFGF